MSKEQTTEEVVAQLKAAIQATFENPVSTRRATVQMLRRFLDCVEQAPKNVEFGKLVVDFRTGKIDCDKFVTLDKPLTRYVGEYSVENPFKEESGE